MRLIKSSLALSLLASLFTFQANAENYLIKNATVHTATAKGTLKNVDVLVQNGRIVKVGQELAVAGKATVVDGTGKHVTPGLINAATRMGLVEISAVANTVDASTKLENMGASFNISPAINFRSTLIPQNRINGLTRAIVLPGNGKSIFAGQGAAIKLTDTLEGLLSDNVAQVAAYGESGAGQAGGSRASAMKQLDQALSDADYYRKNQTRFMPGTDFKLSQSTNDLKALFPVLDRKTPLVISAHRADDIQRLIALANKHNIKIVISGGGEAWLVADDLAKAKVPVIMDPMQNLPRFESLAVRLDGAAKLYRAGVKLLFTGGGSHNGYLVRQSAGNAVAYGLPAEAAIEAMTINTAEVFGITNYGQIRVGMDADIVLWDGDPLDVTSNPDLVLIQGKNIPLVSRATRLRDRYWELKGNHEQAYQY
ncbi:amidohydrolase family protein [Aliikangiella marina]|uniref:Amidohydrolase family protein n=1 Tax=Aliikangiella marina TaxID=1712262 RepID=A0A545TDF4_9GAMM|nr:amidohydrolase family protein [Aliikangiella marina]TQV75249.1 amidohydrolase family protein [Aliikangiella marina]